MPPSESTYCHRALVASVGLSLARNDAYRNRVVYDWPTFFNNLSFIYSRLGQCSMRPFSFLPPPSTCHSDSLSRSVMTVDWHNPTRVLAEYIAFIKFLHVLAGVYM